MFVGVKGIVIGINKVAAAGQSTIFVFAFIYIDVFSFRILGIVVIYQKKLKTPQSEFFFFLEFFRGLFPVKATEIAAEIFFIPFYFKTSKYLKFLFNIADDLLFHKAGIVPQSKRIKLFFHQS